MTTRPEKNIEQREINFLIDHIDPLGQGVYKEGEDIFFIPNTLPNETGSAKVLKKKKNIHFCSLIKLDSKSQDRIEPECEHFNQCSGCHFLHTNYENEIEFKSSSFKRMLKKIDVADIQIIQAPHRLHYRNRIQLHRNRKKIGFYKYQSKDVVEVPNCQIIQTELESNLKKVYKERPHFKDHMELYYRDGEVNTSFDLRYAQGGFTQVNEKANEKMLSKIQELIPEKNISIMDLFAGNGNISNVLNYKTRMCIDIYPESYADFVNLDLYSPDSIKKIREAGEIDLLILDPPRAGFKEFSQWVKKFSPKRILYISCHPMTMVRDISNLDKSYQVYSAFLVDLFPATFHFEGMLLLEKR